MIWPSMVAKFVSFGKEGAEESDTRAGKIAGIGVRKTKEIDVSRGIVSGQLCVFESDVDMKATCLELVDWL